MPIEGLTTRVTTRTTRNEKGRFRVAGIEVELVPEVPETDSALSTTSAKLPADAALEGFQSQDDVAGAGPATGTHHNQTHVIEMIAASARGHWSRLGMTHRRHLALVRLNS